MEAQQNAEGRGGASLESAEGGGEALRKRLERRVGGNGGFRTSPEAVNTQMPKRVSGKGPRETGWQGKASSMDTHSGGWKNSRNFPKARRLHKALNTSGTHEIQENTIQNSYVCFHTFFC